MRLKTKLSQHAGRDTRGHATSAKRIGTPTEQARDVGESIAARIFDIELGTSATQAGHDNVFPGHGGQDQVNIKTCCRLDTAGRNAAGGHSRKPFDLGQCELLDQLINVFRAATNLSQDRRRPTWQGATSRHEGTTSTARPLRCRSTEAVVAAWQDPGK